MKQVFFSAAIVLAVGITAYTSNIKIKNYVNLDAISKMAFANPNESGGGGVECETEITHVQDGVDPGCGIVHTVYYTCNWADSGNCQDGSVQTSDCGVIRDDVWEIDCATGSHT